LTSCERGDSREFQKVQFIRSVNCRGYVSVHRCHIYVECALSRQRVSVWICEGQLHVKYRETLLAQYQCEYDRRQERLQSVSQPVLYPTPFPSPQLELFELDAGQWLKVYQRSYQRRDGRLDIYVMKADGTGQSKLTNAPWKEAAPAWSPDGTRIAFVSNCDGNHDIYLMNADGSEQTQLTNHPAMDLRPVWSPGGEQVVFSSTRDGNAEVYVMSADGSEVTNLTNHLAGDFVPTWQPRMSAQPTRRNKGLFA
jgi:WD40 repeat protein